MDRPTDRDYRNLEERNAAYWREQADKQAAVMQTIHADLVAAQIAANAALAEYNASK
jgi:hypothetical protein